MTQRFESFMQTPEDKLDTQKPKQIVIPSFNEAFSNYQRPEYLKRQRNVWFVEYLNSQEEEGPIKYFDLNDPKKKAEMEEAAKVKKQGGIELIEKSKGRGREESSRGESKERTSRAG